MTTIIEYDPSWHEKVVQHILGIQNEEFHLDLTLEEQPDLISIENSYQETGGNFWIAVNENDDVAGTIALFNLGHHLADLRKMFVKPAYRGKENGVSKGLADILVSWAIENKYEKIYLETNPVFKAAVKFYHKNGFRQIEQNLLPDNFPVSRVGKYFFVRDLAHSEMRT
ncbi:MAG TPA: GNAT family N-acetyltransferase [Bacteroidia bacterium]|nr:GNAT family N-acetyltransferase [Bacteroidia bacterium]